ncbi:zf-HC2 domain-containing protein [Streptomyces sp. KK5PA1]|uniref:Zf-HC2 domain-containing protein n=2 Tax=Actinacidiphila acididurans TaxID=2784346 RepID=A0ABS2TSD0_9ACTN|nr:zf-HC2 domain-containing protein [Actinacidiphila acididurans]
MNCLRVQRVLQSYLDGETDAATVRRVEAHLEDCRRCGLEAAVHREIKAAFTRREAPDRDAVERLTEWGRSLMDPPGSPGDGSRPPRP